MVAPAPNDAVRFAAWWRGGAEAELRRVLTPSWDPIGVAGEPAADDEHERYLPGLARVLLSGAAAADAAAPRVEIERTEMGLPTASADPRTLVAGRQARDWYAGR